MGAFLAWMTGKPPRYHELLADNALPNGSR